MPIPTHLLERAYQLIDANQFQNAELVLDAVVRVDPQNVEAWKTYLMIHQSQNDLNWLKDRILKTRELGKQDKFRLIEYYQYLTSQLSEPNEGAGQTNIPSFFLQEEEETQAQLEDMENTGLELLDVFDYPKKTIDEENLSNPRPRLRRRALYNPFTVDFARNILEAMSQNSFGKKLASHLEEPTTLIHDFIKNPEDTFTKFSRSPHFRRNSGVSLLILFILGIRIAISSNLLGFIILGIFVMGSWRWLLNHENYSPSQTRIYSQESTHSLHVVEEEEEVEVD